jgi:type II secretory pathway pseudopilin PulG
MRRALGIGAGGQAGFTAVELAVVALVISLLCAIAIPSFYGQRAKARDAQAKVEVRTAQTAIEIYATDHDGSYGGASASALQQIEPMLRDVPSSDLTVQPMGTSGKYRLAVVAATGNEFSIRRENDNSTSYRCTNAGNGGCPPNGVWG